MFPIVRQSVILIGMCVLFVLLCARANEDDVLYDLPTWREEPDELDLDESMMPPPGPCENDNGEEIPCDHDGPPEEEMVLGPDSYPDMVAH